MWKEVIMLRSQKPLAAVLGVHYPMSTLVAVAVVSACLLASWIASRIVLSGASPVLTFRTLTDALATPTSVATTFDVNAALASAPADAPVQHASAIACTYILKDGHRCD